MLTKGNDANVTSQPVAAKSRRYNSFESQLMKSLFFLFLLHFTLYCQEQSVLPQPAIIDTTDIKEAMTVRDNLFDRQMNMLKLHKTFAYTTGGLILATDAVGLYHFLSMMNEAHKYRNAHHINRRSPDFATLQADEIKAVWNESQSQAERVVHGALVVSSAICYTTTATIELTMPRLNNDPLYMAKVKLHRNLFFAHASLMAANIGLGFAESYALSRGNHGALVPLGIAHLAVGFALPLVLCGSGLVFN